jgi:hypothetical protein
MPTTEDAVFDMQPNNDFNPLRRPRSADPEDDFADIVLNVPAMIREGEASNAPMLKLKCGDAAKVRLLQFGEPARSISVITRHLVYQFGKLGCPKRTDPALGGDKQRSCPLCDLLHTGAYPKHLTPELSIEIWAYVLVLAVKKGGIWQDTDLESVDRPHRLRFEGTSKTRVHVELTKNPLLAHEVDGTNLLIRASSVDNWQLSLLDTAPLQLSKTPHIRENQRQRIARWLGEPHMWRERQVRDGAMAACGDAYPVATEEELDAAAKNLIAHNNAPGRSNSRFWEQIMQASLPSWSPNTQNDET